MPNFLQASTSKSGSQESIVIKDHDAVAIAQSVIEFLLVFLGRGNCERLDRGDDSRTDELLVSLEVVGLQNQDVRLQLRGQVCRRNGDFSHKVVFLEGCEQALLVT